MRMSRLRKRKAPFKSIIMNFNTLVIIIMSLIFILGIIIGSFMLNNIEQTSDLFYLWNSYTENNFESNIFENIFKYGKTVILIWFCGFFKYGFLGILSLVFFKGLSVGYTSSFIIKTTGFEGIFFIAHLYLFQTAFLFLLYLFSGIIILKFIINKNKNNKNFSRKNYYIFGIILITAVLLLSLL